MKHPDSVQALLMGEALFAKLTEAGLNEEIYKAITSNPMFAEFVVDTARRSLPRKEEDPRVARQRGRLNATIFEHRALNIRQKRILEAMKIVTVGDLAMTTASVIESNPAVSRELLSIVHRLLAENNLLLRNETSDPLAVAIGLYGGAEYVPAKYMPRWISGLDGLSMRYLSNAGTLGGVSSRTSRDYRAWRMGHKSQNHEVCEAQIERIKKGLQIAGLWLRL